MQLDTVAGPETFKKLDEAVERSLDRVQRARYEKKRPQRICSQR